MGKLCIFHALLLSIFLDWFTLLWHPSNHRLRLDILSLSRNHPRRSFLDKGRLLFFLFFVRRILALKSIKVGDKFVVVHGFFTRLFKVSLLPVFFNHVCQLMRIRLDSLIDLLCFISYLFVLFNLFDLHKCLFCTFVCN